MRRSRVGLALLLPLAAGSADARAAEKPPLVPAARVTRAPFGKTAGGDLVEVFTLRNARGLEARILDYGAAIVSLHVPDRTGRLDDIVLGYDDVRGYETNDPHFGSLIGRYCNRIAKGRFPLDGKTIQLTTNSGGNHLHGGEKGFDRVLWKAVPFESADRTGLVLTHTSPDGHEGYPGTVKATVTYALTDANELLFDYGATTDKPTAINLTQHTYFNLAGASSGDVLGHELTLAASRFAAVDAELIPTGVLTPVEGTPFDFRKPVTVGARIDAAHEQLRAGNGYDHNFVLDGPAGTLRPAAELYEPKTGRVMDVRTTEPGVQVYSANFLDGRLRGKSGAAYVRRSGLCLETQHFPDSPNRPEFPSTILRPGQEYRAQTVLTFSTR